MAEKEKQSDEIDLVEIIRKLWAGKRTLLISTTIGLALGIFLMIISPLNYTSESTLLIETEATVEPGMSDLLQQIAGAAGIQVNQKQINHALTPDLYPLIINSTPYLLEVLDQKVSDPKDGKLIKVADYLEKYPPSSLKSILVGNTIGLPGKIAGLFSKDEDDSKVSDSNFTINSSSVKIKDTLSIKDSLSDEIKYIDLTKKQIKAAKRLQNCIDAAVYNSVKKPIGATPNILKIITTVHESSVASQLNMIVVNRLIKYITDYRTRKVKNDLMFITIQCDEAESKYKKAQQNFASYQDRIQHVVFTSSKTEEARFKSENDVAFAVLNSLSQVKEQAKIKVQEQTPVFTSINPPSKAKQESSYSIVILTVLPFLGFIFGVGIIYIFPKITHLVLTIHKKNLS